MILKYTPYGMYHWLAQAFGHARIRIMEVPSPVATLFFPFLDASFMRECVNACSGPANLRVMDFGICWLPKVLSWTSVQPCFPMSVVLLVLP